ncbi:MAG: hypothetical protein ACI9N9_002153, partial [Enterobacterales bacterium]
VSFCMPSGVISKTQEAKITKGKPIKPKKKTAVLIQSGKCKAGTAA